jgi:hypothetical protein
MNRIRGHSPQVFFVAFEIGQVTAPVINIPFELHHHLFSSTNLGLTSRVFFLAHWILHCAVPLPPWVKAILGMLDW